MRVCVVAYKFGTEQEIGEHLGTYHYFIEILRRLVKAGHQVEVIAPWHSFSQKGSLELDGVKILRYRPPLLNKIWLFPLNRIIRFWYLKATQKQVLNCQRDFNPDVVFVWQARETGYAVAQIKNKLQCPFIFRQITTWRWHFNRKASEIFKDKSEYQLISRLKLNKIIDSVLEFLLDRKSQKKYAQLIYQQADKVAFVSQIAAQEAIELGLAKDKVEVLPVCIETDLFKPLGDKESLRKELGIFGQKVILFIGRINFAEKGIGYLLEAMPEVIHEVSQANLVIIGGGGESQRMNELINQLKLEKNVQTVGKKSFNELVRYINAADVFVVPSVWLETFGQVTIEAMACGVPVVTFDAGASPDINISGQTGLVVPAKNSPALAEAIIKILSDDNLRLNYGQAARERVLANYTYEVVINKLITIINRAKDAVGKR